MDRLLQDVRYALRGLIKNPAFTAIAVFSIALGIGANATVFSVVNATLLKTLPYKEAERIVLTWGRTAGEGSLNERNQVSATDVADFRSQNSVFEDITTYTGWMPVLSGAGETERIPAIQVGDGFFNIMKGEPILGRVFTAEEQQDGKDFVIVLSYGLWQRHFNGDASIIGKTVELNSRSYTVVGVMPADFRPLPSTLVAPEGQLYRPVAESYDNEQRDARHLRAIARLKQGVSIQQAQADFSGIADRLEETYPQSNKGYGIHLVTLSDDMLGSIKPALWMLLGAVVFVLLVACANVGNLLLARSTARQKEIAIRTALGAGRKQIVQQLLIESLLLSVTGGILGLLFAMWGTSVVESVTAQIHPLLKDIHIDWRVLAFTFALSVFTGIIFGLAPALQTSKTDLNESLKEGGRNSTAGASRNRLRGALVIAEVAMTLVLLVGAGLLIKTIFRLQAVNIGFNSQNVLAMDMGLPQIKYPKKENVALFYKQVVDRIEALPGVKAAGISSVLPLSGNFDGRGLAVEDHPKPPGEEINVDLYVVTPNYLRAMETTVLQGRALTEQDRETSAQVALINETMARQLWADDNPLGKRIKFPGSDKNPQQWREIVGIVSDVSQYALDEKPPMQIYLPHSQFPTYFNTLVVKTDREPEKLAAAVRNEILAVDKDQAAFNITTLEKLYADSIALRRFFMLLLMVFAGLALSLASIGIYGVISYSVSQRTQEIGIRMALGARHKDVLQLVIKQGMMMTVFGVAIGLVAAFALSRLMESLLFGVSTTDAMTFTVVALILTGVALVACFVPALRATKVDPMIALRYE
jgi:putative ABC transport system permease protein